MFCALLCTVVASIVARLLLRSLYLCCSRVLEDDDCEARSEWVIWAHLYPAVLSWRDFGDEAIKALYDTKAIVHRQLSYNHFFHYFV